MTKHLTFIAIVVCLVVCVSILIPEVTASCQEARLCCGGRNNTCFAYGPKDGQQGAEHDRCFCDQECRNMMDCCYDYRSACKAVNCVVSDYSSWGKCDKPCGIGVQVRRRKVHTFPENGGDDCPVLKERRGCIGDDYGTCLQQSIQHRAQELREVSRIIPAKFAHFRSMAKYDPQRDPLRKNLFVDTGYNINEILTKPSYCAHFEVVDRNSRCNDTEKWSSALKPGTKVCLECQPIAMFKALGMRCKGHGVLDEVTEWNAIGVHGCRGHWRMTTQRESCSCSKRSATDFILL